MGLFDDIVNKIKTYSQQEPFWYGVAIGAAAVGIVVLVFRR